MVEAVAPKEGDLVVVRSAGGAPIFGHYVWLDIYDGQGRWWLISLRRYQLRWTMSPDYWRVVSCVEDARD